jgi:hypothetical protein
MNQVRVVQRTCGIQLQLHGHVAKFNGLQWSTCCALVSS